MTVLRQHVRIGIALGVGLLVGWGFAGRQSPRVLASGGDRWGDSVVASGPVRFKKNLETQTAIPDEAVYYLNYATGRLLAMVPTYRQVGTSTQVMGDFAERDLVKDFDLAPGTSPHFLLTTATNGSLADGAALLFVFETTTGQVATYRITPVATVGSSRPQFDLLERKTDRRLGRSTAAR